MIFLLLSPLFLAANVYFAYEAFKWIATLHLPIKAEKIVKILWAVLWALFSVSIFVAFLMPAGISRTERPFLYALRRTLKQIGNYHLAVLIYMGMALVLILIGRLVQVIMLKRKGLDTKTLFDSALYKNKRAVMGVITIAFIVLITLYGVGHAGDIKINTYDVTVEKEAAGADSLKIALIADMHLGYTIGCEHMEKMVRLVNASEPDIIIIAGDIFDNECEALDDPERLIEILSGMKSRYGTYAVYGNHDIEEKIVGGFTFNYHDPNKSSSREMDEFLERSGIRLLMDEYVLINDAFYIYGRPDYSKPGKSIIKRKTADELVQGLDLSKPLFVIDHEPYELRELADAGVDIDLSGHTHDGQFFPLNITSRLFVWENSAGVLKKDNMYSIVTSGVGLYGPAIRIGTDAEICIINVSFK